VRRNGAELELLRKWKWILKWGRGDTESKLNGKSSVNRVIWKRRESV